MPGWDLDKYEAAGNDFVISLEKSVNGISLLHQSLDQSWVGKLCDRRRGIGADGYIVLAPTASSWTMHYWNSDGAKSTLCGNGLRAATLHLHRVVGGDQFDIIAADGQHHTRLLSDGLIEAEMRDVARPTPSERDWILDTGSPHYIQFVDRVDSLDVKALGRLIRNSSEFAAKGINVNFVEPLNANTISVRTYERGVEDETLSCGTGVTAAAIAHVIDRIAGYVKKLRHPDPNFLISLAPTSNESSGEAFHNTTLTDKTFELIQTFERVSEDKSFTGKCTMVTGILVIRRLRELSGRQSIEVITPGGTLMVKFEINPDGRATAVRLIGPARWVFAAKYGE